MKTFFAYFGVFHLIVDLAFVLLILWLGRAATDAEDDREYHPGFDGKPEADEKRPFAG